MPPPTLRERTREALSVHEPDERTARADLDAVLARTGPRRRPRPWVVALAPATAAVVIVLWLARRPAQPAPEAASIELYIHVHGEPENRALAFTLETNTKKAR